MSAHVLSELTTLPPATGAQLRTYAPKQPYPSVTASPVVGNQGGRQAIEVASLPAAASSNVPSIGSELLGKVTLSRSNVNVGYVLTDQTFTVTAWNTDYTQSAMVTRLDNSDQDAITLTGPQPVFRIPPGGAVQYTVQVKVVGKSTIDDSLRVVVAELGDASPALRLFGSRMVVFPLAPDWSAGFDEQLTHATSILTSHSGVEQRAMLREAPVRALTFTVSAMDDAEAGQLEALLWAWQARIFGVPVWSDERALTAPATAGATTVYCDTSYSEMKAGGYALVWSDSFTFDAVQISAVQSDRVVLAFPLTKDYPRGAKVLPISFARLDEQLTVQHDAAAVSTAQLTFTVE